MNDKEHVRVMALLAQVATTTDIKVKLLEFRQRNNWNDPNFDQIWQILTDLYDSYKKQI